MEYSFLEYARLMQVSDTKGLRPRNFKRGPGAGRTVAVGVRYKYELTDLYFGHNGTHGQLKIMTLMFNV